MQEEEGAIVRALLRLTQSQGLPRTPTSSHTCGLEEPQTRPDGHVSKASSVHACSPPSSAGPSGGGTQHVGSARRGGRCEAPTADPAAATHPANAIHLSTPSSP